MKRKRKAQSFRWRLKCNLQFFLFIVECGVGTLWEMNIMKNLYYLLYLVIFYSYFYIFSYIWNSVYFNEIVFPTIFTIKVIIQMLQI